MVYKTCGVGILKICITCFQINASITVVSLESMAAQFIVFIMFGRFLINKKKTIPVKEVQYKWMKGKISKMFS